MYELSDGKRLKVLVLGYSVDEMRRNARPNLERATYGSSRQREEAA